MQRVAYRNLDVVKIYRRNEEGQIEGEYFILQKDGVECIIGEGYLPKKRSLWRRFLNFVDDACFEFYYHILPIVTLLVIIFFLGVLARIFILGH